MNKMSKKPAALIKLNNDIKPGNLADLTIIDTEREYKIDPEKFESKSRNTPFTDFKVKGCAVLTMVNGRIVYQ